MDDIIIVAYDLSWPLLFDKEADLIRQALGKRLEGIEHFGSTAVPGLAAKPVIDIMIATRTPEDWPSLPGATGATWLRLLAGQPGPKPDVFSSKGCRHMASSGRITFMSSRETARTGDGGCGFATICGCTSRRPSGMRL